MQGPLPRTLLALVAAAACLAPPPAAWGICPQVCRCTRDSRGRKQVVCDGGGLAHGVPVKQMEYDIWRLVVTAPPGRSNNMSLSRIFFRFKELHEIHITNSRLPAIGDTSFKGLTSLEVLNLTDNNINQLMDTNFDEDLRNLKSLHLDNNVIRPMPSAVFHNLHSLRRLTLSNNSIIEVAPRLFLNLTSLEQLDLRSNPLQHNVDANMFKDVRRLRALNLSDCRQTIFNSALLRHVPFLRVLDLSHNRLQYFSIEDARDATQLRELYLHGNRISSVFNHTFLGLDLRTLTLSFNQLRFLHRESFFNVTIRELDISYNQVQITDPNLLVHIAGKLQLLYIGGNRLTQHTLGRLLPQLPHLQTLGIGGLRLGEIQPRLLQFPATLRTLNVSHNGLTHFPVPSLVPLRQHLQTLDLSHNGFLGLDQDVLSQFDAMRQLQRLYLHGNPWACDECYIPVLMSWLNQTRLFERACQPDAPAGERSCLRCASPPELTGRAFQLLEYSRLGGCHGEGLLRRTSSAFHRGHVGLAVAGVLLLLLAVTVVLVVLMYYRRGADYYTHEEDREDDAIYENLGVDDETGDLLNDKKARLSLPSPPVAAAATDGNGHAAHDGRRYVPNAVSGRDNGVVGLPVGDQC